MKLHTLMFGWEYPPHHSGGLGVACQGLVRGLLGNGVRVTLVLPHNLGEGEDQLDVRFPTEEMKSQVLVPSILDPYDGVRSYEERWQKDCIAKDNPHLYGPDLAQAVEQFTALSVELTKDVAADVVHCHDWMTYEAGLRAAKHHGKPLVTHIHATEFDRTDFHPNSWIAERERRGLMAADRVIAVSNYTKKLLVSHYGIPSGKISVVHNGHDQPRDVAPPALLARYGSRRHPLILFLGRLTVQKNPWQFLEIARLVRAHRPDAEFVMAGDGPMMPQLIDRACALGLQDSVIFTGKVDKREVQSLYQAASVFVMPSLSEPFGLVALEAIAHGAPVIVSKQSGVAEVLDHAFKVDYWDAEKMADCILTILREEPLALQLKTEAPRILQRLTWRNQADKVRSIYSNLSHS
ncbi:MAG: glycosyltransferase family 4 protein [Candidatus Peribacteraceae bacterium]|jgi:glycosyltransferase involved in cell wall biosynthesis